VLVLVPGSERPDQTADAAQLFVAVHDEEIDPLGIVVAGGPGGIHVLLWAQAGAPIPLMAIS
jgi:hypothetical protein